LRRYPGITGISVSEKEEGRGAYSIFWIFLLVKN